MVLRMLILNIYWIEFIIKILKKYMNIQKLHYLMAIQLLVFMMMEQSFIVMHL